MATCARCGGEVGHGDAFCRTCGATAGGGGDGDGLTGAAGPATLVEDAVWPDGSPALQPYEPLEGRARWARLLVGAAAALALLAAPLNLHRADAIQTWFATGDSADLERSDDWFAILALPSTLVGIAAIVVFLVWFSRAYRNLPALGARRLRFTPGWAVGAWFVPFLNLWRPKAMANDIWRAGDPALPSGPTADWRGNRVAGLVHWWWGIYLASLLRFSVTVNDVGLEESDADLARIEAVYNLLTAIAGVLAIRFIGRVTERQQERAQRAGAA